MDLNMIVNAAENGISCFFTGHRPDKFVFRYDEKHPHCIRIKWAITIAILDAIDAGFRIFYSGMALGMDTWAAEIILNLRDKFHLPVKLYCAIPCAKQWATWPASSKARWESITARADKVIQVSDKPYAGKLMQDRNKYMVNHSVYGIALFDNTAGGTANCVAYARDEGVRVCIIDPNNLPVVDTKEVVERAKRMRDSLTK